MVKLKKTYKPKKPRILYSYYDYFNLFFLRTLTSDRAKELNFRPVYLNDDEKSLYYKYRFPVVFWERKSKALTPTLFCELTIEANGKHRVIVDTFKPCGDTYAYFYCTEITTTNRFIHPMLIQIHKTIQNKLKELGRAHSRKELRELGGKENDDRTGIQEVRKPEMGYSGADKQIQRRKTRIRDTSK